jgi:uncharacterized integral membrane protein (TIGR00701 family)
MDALRNELSNYIPWFLALHIIAVIAWMAAMLYLPRLFVYHTEAAPGSESSERFKVMERRPAQGDHNPSMIAVWILGLLLAWLTGAYMIAWLQHQIRAGDHLERHARSVRELLARLCRRPQHPFGALLPHRQ